jgi:site-specific recombinase XerD
MKGNSFALISQPENAALYSAFLDYYRPRVSAQGYQTLKHLSRLVICRFEQKNIPLDAVSIQDAMEFRKNLYEHEGGKPLSAGTVCNYLKVGRKLFGYLVKFQKRKTNPFYDVKYPRLPDGISRNILNEMQMSRLLEFLSLFNEAETECGRLEQYRSHVVAVLLYATGMRIAEAAGLLPQDIDIKRREVVIRNGKGGKSRIAFLSGYAADVLDYYMRYGRNILLARGWRKHPRRLFGVDAATLQSSVNRILSAVCLKLKIPVITCHGFRHSLGTHLLRAGCDIRHIQMILGHENLNSTQQYTRVDRDDLKNILDRYHPRQSKKQEGAAV